MDNLISLNPEKKKKGKRPKTETLALRERIKELTIRDKLEPKTVAKELNISLDTFYQHRKAIFQDIVNSIKRDTVDNLIIEGTSSYDYAKRIALEQIRDPRNFDKDRYLRVFLDAENNRIKFLQTIGLAPLFQGRVEMESNVTVDIRSALKGAYDELTRDKQSGKIGTPK